MHTKYISIINKVNCWAQSMSAAFSCTVYGMYVRGSAAFGAETKYSDLDLVVLLSNCHLNNLQGFKRTLASLTTSYALPYPVGIKVFTVNTDYIVEPPIDLVEPLRERAKKHINFDLCANGFCFSGREIKDQLNVFDSPKEFKENNQIIWGLEIKELIEYMQNNIHFDDYYTLIKKCIRLSAYLHFDTESVYYGSTVDCFNFAIQENTLIRDKLILLFDYLQKNSREMSEDYLKMLKGSIVDVSNYLLSE